MRITKKILENQIDGVNLYFEREGYKARFTLQSGIGYTLYLTDVERMKTGRMIRSVAYGPAADIARVLDGIHLTVITIIEEKRK